MLPFHARNESEARDFTSGKEDDDDKTTEPEPLVIKMNYIF